jgi:hypothetical protein
LGVTETSPIIVAVTKHMTTPVKTTSMTCIACPPFGECSAFTIFGAKIGRADDVEIITSGRTILPSGLVVTVTPCSPGA